jgi:hypothetical protein
VQQAVDRHQRRLRRTDRHHLDGAPGGTSDLESVDEFHVILRKLPTVLDNTRLPPADASIQSREVDAVEVHAPDGCAMLDSGRDVADDSGRMRCAKHGTDPYPMSVGRTERTPQSAVDVATVPDTMQGTTLHHRSDASIGVAIGEELATEYDDIGEIDQLF